MACRYFRSPRCIPRSDTDSKDPQPPTPDLSRPACWPRSPPSHSTARQRLTAFENPGNISFMYTRLPEGERLTCRKCRTEAWCIPTTDGLRVGCSSCGYVITNDHAEAMCFEQRLYVEASRYRDQVGRAGSTSAIPIPESVKEFRKQLMPGDRAGYPIYSKLLDPNWPFRYVAVPV